MNDDPRQSRLSFPCQREVKMEMGVGGEAETSTNGFEIASLERQRRAEPYILVSLCRSGSNRVPFTHWSE